MSEVRLTKFLASCGVGSRRFCDQLVSDGGVVVNGEICREPFTRVNPDKDVVVVDGKVCKCGEKRHYVLLNKPRGYICSNKDPFAKKLAIDLIEIPNTRLFSIGRLDKDSEGLILFTDDGDFAQKVNHPSNGIVKTYRVSIYGLPPRKEQLDSLCEHGLEDNGEVLKPVSVRIVRTHEDGAVLEMVLSEGKNREIRRICEALNWDVKRLDRIKIGFLEDKSLKIGAWRELTKGEVDSFLK